MERFFVGNRDAAAIHLDETAVLEAGQRTGDDLPSWIPLRGEMALVLRHPAQRANLLLPLALPFLRLPAMVGVVLERTL